MLEDPSLSFFKDYLLSYVFTHWEETAHSYYINIQAQRFWDFLRAKYTCQIKNSVHDNNSTLDEV
ncbi:hypothetical protein GIB67_001684 [Kingdonia uniflora]|uniref:Uncharacterized protein n=1 Tax=Kingdonia uniflora TaxID=39325 RepID=A0A7J7LMY8_9MAGN|nr:hypothetical protein GIB67_001684 [Kingdonia uniflora]